MTPCEITRLRIAREAAIASLHRAKMRCDMAETKRGFDAVRAATAALMKAENVRRRAMEKEMNKPAATDRNREQ